MKVAALAGQVRHNGHRLQKDSALLKISQLKSWTTNNLEDLFKREKMAWVLENVEE